MSIAADLQIVDREVLAMLTEDARPRRGRFGRSKPGTFHEEAFAAAARDVEAFDGIAIAALVEVLDANGAPLLDDDPDRAATLLSQARGATTVIFTSEDKGLLPLLDPAGYSEEELRAHAEDLYEGDEPDIGSAMHEALATLHRHVAALDERSALVLTITV